MPGIPFFSIRILFLLLVLWTGFKVNDGLCKSQDYYLGYAQSVIDDVIPEEEVHLTLEQRRLSIHINGQELDPRLEQILLNRLKRKNHFFKIQVISEKNKMNTGSQAAVPLSTCSETTTEFMPNNVVYNAPVADPKWPRFSVGLQKHFTNTYGKNGFSLSFGENLPLLQQKNSHHIYELGIQAGLYGLMDIASTPTRLINSDYFVGIGLSYAYDKTWQNLLQFSHLSSHLGDELLISKPDLIRKRINLSYETLKWLTAYKFKNIRPYAGIGYLVHCDPSHLKRLTLEGGMDYLSESSFLFDTTRFVAGFYLHGWQENNFKPSFNARAGLQFDNPVYQGRFLQLLLDYGVGKSRHGQFYAKHEHYTGFVISLAH